MSPSDHHSEYLSRAVAALTPAGRDRVDELLGQLGEAVGGDERVVRFALARKAEVDAGRADSPTNTEPLQTLTEQELDGLLAGFMRIRDQEPLDEVADWANAVVAVLEDEARSDRPG